MECQPIRRRSAVCVALLTLVPLLLSSCASSVPKPSPVPGPAEISGTRTPGKTTAGKGRLPAHSRPYQIASKWYYPLATHEGYQETGYASWYGEPFHGRQTASGEPYDKYELTCAHKTLPLGCRVKVTHVRTGRSVILRVNDRGPFVPGRIVDLSFAAARKLGMLNQGVARVKVEALSGPPVPQEVMEASMVADDVPADVKTVEKPAPETWPLRNSVLTIQVGAFLKKDNAEKVRQRLGGDRENVAVENGPWRDGPYYTVRVGRFADARAAETKLNELKNAGFKDAFFVFLEE